MAAYEVGVLRIIPGWIGELVDRLVPESEKRDVHFVMEKTFGRSDLDPRERCFILPSSNFELHVVRLLSPAERLKIFKNRRGTKGPEEKPKLAKLKVKVFVRSGWMFHMDLARDCRDNTVMIRGREWKCLLDRCDFRENDAVEMWAFRCRVPPPPRPSAASSSNSSSSPPESLCFILGKKKNAF